MKAKNLLYCSIAVAALLATGCKKNVPEGGGE